MTRPIFTFARGAPIGIGLRIDDAGAYDPSTLTTSMLLKKAVNMQPPPKTQAAAATFSVSYVPASGGNAAYWLGSLDAATAGALAVGSYVTDLELLQSGTPIAVTDYAVVVIAESVTPS